MVSVYEMSEEEYYEGLRQQHEEELSRMQKCQKNLAGMAAALSVGAMNIQFSPRPLGRKTVADFQVSYHRQSKRSWVCTIRQNGRTRTGKGSTKNAAYVAAFNNKS